MATRVEKRGATVYRQDPILVFKLPYLGGVIYLAGTVIANVFSHEAQLPKYSLQKG